MQYFIYPCECLLRKHKFSATIRETRRHLVLKWIGKLQHKDGGQRNSINGILSRTERQESMFGF
jgi:hypothetical protein